MCGIFGLLKQNSTISGRDISLTRRASDLMIHRGPDDEGLWSNEQASLAFRRLSIIDLSQRGHQPMVSPDGRYVLVYNGELYNYPDLKKTLTGIGHGFCSTSDTEVVLSALIEWGSDAMTRFNGMFAFCFYDTQEQSMLMARDHVGMKPLYIGYTNEFVVAASQLNQVMLAFSPGKLNIDAKGLNLFLALGYYPSPRTVFNEIKQVEAGTWLKFYHDGRREQGKHFDLLEFYRENQEIVLDSSELAIQLRHSVKRHLISDVPVATFLSGGLDSSIITGMTSEIQGNDFTAYTLGNPGSVYDESARASQIAKKLGVKHKLVFPDGLAELISDFEKAYQEPFGDYSALPSLIVARHARTEVKVMLSGDGSDEFFYGYNRMQSMLVGAGYYRYPLFARKIIKRLKPGVPAITFSDLRTMIYKRQNWLPVEMEKVSGIPDEELIREFFGDLGNHDLPPDMLIKLNTIQRYFQLQLLKLDRASMFNSIEARVPFADKEFIRYSIAYRAKDATCDNFAKRKLPVSKVFTSMFPDIPLDTGPKRGFTIDMQRLLHNELKPMVTDLLNTRSPFDGNIDFALSRKLFENHDGISPFFFWSLVSLQLWAARYHN
jgi:asparagine synthase (glutamine-hydrolysing)